MAGLHKYEFGVYILVCMDGRKAENDAKKEARLLGFSTKSRIFAAEITQKPHITRQKRRKFEDT